MPAEDDGRGGQGEAADPGARLASAAGELARARERVDAAFDLAVAQPGSVDVLERRVRELRQALEEVHGALLALAERRAGR